VIEPVDRHRLVYRWDLDKTYLRTEFDTVKDWVRTAFETARDKQTVPGAGALLREIRGTDPFGVYIVSGSPEQLRRVLEAKLRLDGVRWDGLVLKPQLTNILRGRFKSIRDQVGYKLGAMLETRASLPVDTEEFMFGDDAEADAFIYCLYADLCAGRVTPALFMQLLESAETYPDAMSRLVRLAEHMPRGGRARRIFIHLDRVSPTDSFADLGNRVCTFHNYFQPALVLMRHGALDPLAVLRVGGELLAEHGFTPDALVASYADLARRGQISGAEALRLLTYLSSADDSTFGAAATPLRRFAEQLDRDSSRQAPEPAEDAMTVADWLRAGGAGAHERAVCETAVSVTASTVPLRLMSLQALARKHAARAGPGDGSELRFGDGAGGFAQRIEAACLAAAERSSLDMRAARIAPPFMPPRLPISAAAWFLIGTRIPSAASEVGVGWSPVVPVRLRMPSQIAMRKR
jgi:hypothetical protein